MSSGQQGGQQGAYSYSRGGQGPSLPPLSVALRGVPGAPPAPSNGGSYGDSRGNSSGRGTGYSTSHSAHQQSRTPHSQYVYQRDPSGRLVERIDRPPRSSTQDPSRPYPCDIPGCTKRFERPVDLDTHIRSHTGERPFVCRFPGCGKAFSVKSNMSRHEKTHTAHSQFESRH